MFYRCRNLSRDALRVYNLPLYNVLQTKIRFVYNFIENALRIENAESKSAYSSWKLAQPAEHAIKNRDFNQVTLHSLQLDFSQNFGASKNHHQFLWMQLHMVPIPTLTAFLQITFWNTVFSPTISVLFQYLIYSVNCTLIWMSNNYFKEHSIVFWNLVDLIY